MKLRYIIGLLAMFIASKAMSCPIKNYQDLVRCASEQSAATKMAQRQFAASTHLEAIAKQWQNPELDVESVHKGRDKAETTAALLFNIRLGGKKAAAVQEARAESTKAEATRDLTAAQTKLNLILKLYQLRHLQSEIGFEEESVNTFTKIINQFQGRPALSPEQQVSLSVFKMAMADHQLSLTQLRTEQEAVMQEIITQTGIAQDVIVQNLPPQRSSWPGLPVTQGITASPHLRFASGEMTLAKSQMAKANAEAWPDVKIGPAIKMQNEAGVSDNLIGASLSMSLPLLNQNQAGKSYGQEKLAEAELNYQFSERKVLSMKEQLAMKYKNIVSALKGSLSTKALEERHEQMERHFFKGVVPSSLVIEAHRQLIDLEQKKNKAEREAIEALGSLYILDNKFAEVIL